MNDESGGGATDASAFERSESSRSFVPCG